MDKTTMKQNFFKNKSNYYKIQKHQLQKTLKLCQSLKSKSEEGSSEI